MGKPALKDIIDSALKNNELGSFEVHYQPIVSAHHHKIISSEALVRLRTNDGELMYPNQFLPTVSEFGLMNRIGRKVMKSAVEQNFKWCEHGHNISVHVNMAPIEFSIKTCYLVSKMLRCTKMNAKQLVIEVTESGIKHREHFELICKVATSLRKMKIGVAIDDFGEGDDKEFECDRLQKFPATSLKINYDVTQNLNSAQAEKVFRGFITLAQRLGMQVIVEKVEDETDVKMLEGINGFQNLLAFQGWYFYKAMPASEMTKILN